MKRYSTIMSVLLTLALPVAATCADAPKAPEKTDAITKSMSKSKHSSMMGGTVPAAGTAESNPSGKVIETMDGGGYTYASLEKDGKKTWVAYSTLPTRVGDTLAFSGCMEMTNFQSKALNRTFTSVLFCGEPDVKPSAAAKKAAAQKSPGAGAPVAAAGKIQVEKASGANAYTVAEAFAKSGTLNGKQVVVKGQVVKVASGIMNRTWIHLQDGSGTEKQKNNDLVVTSTKDTPAVGDVVTISGTLAKDKDFGSGYKYSVIIEKGSVKK
jgi:hypothetical protein